MSSEVVYTKAQSVYIYNNNGFVFIKTVDKKGNIVEDLEEISIDESIKNSIRLPGRSYNLPSNCIAFEVFEDYLVVAVGVAVKSVDLKKVVSLARRLEKGLILKPAKNIHILYDLDKAVVQYNTLNKYPQRNFN